MKSNEVIDLLEWSGAILKGHFMLTSGRHSNQYIEKFRLLENPIALDKICLTMSEKFKDQNIDLVIGAAIGGILLSGGVGKHLDCKHIFSERVGGKMVFKRGFNIEKKSDVLIVEDIIDTGQSIDFIYNYVYDKGPDDIKIVSFLFKPDVYKLNIKIDWVGFSIDNNFVVGYGMDYNEKFRNLKDIYRLIDEKEEE